MSASRSGVNGLSQSPELQDENIDAKEIDIANTIKGPPDIVGNNDVIAFWDIENSPMWKHGDNEMSLTDLTGEKLHRLKQEMKKYGNGEIKIYPCAALPENSVISLECRALIANGIQIIYAPVDKRVGNHRREAADKKLIAMIKDEKIRTKGAVCFFITGDAGFLPYITDVCERGHLAVLVYPHQTSPGFVRQTFWRDTISWEKLIKNTLERNIPKEAKICEYFDTNVCRYTPESCSKLHQCSICKKSDHGAVKCPKNLEPPVLVCPHFTKGNCRWGNECKLPHTCPGCGNKGTYRCPNQYCKLKRPQKANKTGSHPEKSQHHIKPQQAQPISAASQPTPAKHTKTQESSPAVETAAVITANIPDRKQSAVTTQSEKSAPLAPAPFQHDQTETIERLNTKLELMAEEHKKDRDRLEKKLDALIEQNRKLLDLMMSSKRFGGETLHTPTISSDEKDKTTAKTSKSAPAANACSSSEPAELDTRSVEEDSQVIKPIISPAVLEGATPAAPKKETPTLSKLNIRANVFRPAASQSDARLTSHSNTAPSSSR